MKPKLGKTSEPGTYIRLYVEEAVPIMLESFTKTRCVNATRVCLDVMRRFNVRAEPLSVNCWAMNREFAVRVNRLGRLPERGEVETWPAEAWSVGIDTHSPAYDDSHWAGHLVAIVQKEWLVDSASIQLSRPQKNIPLPDIFVGWVERKFQKGKRPVNFYHDSGAILSYQARVDDLSYQDQPGFSPSPWNREVTEEIIARMLRRLG